MTRRIAFFRSLTVVLGGSPSSIDHASRLWGHFRIGVAAGKRGAPGPLTADESAEVAVDVTDLAAGCAEINRAAVAACPFPAVHAAVVQLPGGAVVIPAVSGAGKSTLAAALCRAGAGYVSDEAFVMDDHGRAIPYPKPLALSDWSLRALMMRPEQTHGEHGPPGAREFLVAPDALGDVTAAPTAVAHIVLPRRGTVGVARLSELPRREGLSTIVALGFNHYREPRRFLLSAAATVSAARVWRLHYDHPVDAAELLTRDLG